MDFQNLKPASLPTKTSSLTRANFTPYVVQQQRDSSLPVPLSSKRRLHVVLPEMHVIGLWLPQCVADGLSIEREDGCSVVTSQPARHPGFQRFLCQAAAVAFITYQPFVHGRKQRNVCLCGNSEDQHIAIATDSGRGSFHVGAAVRFEEAGEVTAQAQLGLARLDSTDASVS